MRASALAVGAGDVGYSRFGGCHPDPDAPDIDDIAERLQAPGAPLDPSDPENIARAAGEQFEGQSPWVDACDALQAGDEKKFCDVVRAITAAYCRREANSRAARIAAQGNLRRISLCEDF